MVADGRPMHSRMRMVRRRDWGRVWGRSDGGERRRRRKSTPTAAPGLGARLEAEAATGRRDSGRAATAIAVERQRQDWVRGAGRFATPGRGRGKLGLEVVVAGGGAVGLGSGGLRRTGCKRWLGSGAQGG